MPPCAQTECERLTGTIENKSTLPPISAILMTAESPASPPPTTIIFGAAAIVSLSAFCNLLAAHCGSPRLNELLRTRPERSEAGQPYARQDEKECQAQNQKSFPRLLPGNDSPFRAKKPDAIGEMPRSCHESHHIKQKQRRLKYLTLHFAKRCVRRRMQIDAREAHGVRVPNDVDERNPAGPALRRVHPIAGPGIGDGVSIPAIPDVKAVKRMKQDGQPDSKKLKEKNQRQST